MELGSKVFKLGLVAKVVYYYIKEKYMANYTLDKDKYKAAFMYIANLLGKGPIHHFRTV